MPKDVRTVLLSGGGGGLVWWAYTIATKGATFGLNQWQALPLGVILGMAAALIAVYLVTPADVTKIGKLIAFSVLCGFLWKPVLDAGKTMLTEQLQTAQKTEQVKQATRSLNQPASPAAVAARTNQVVSNTTQLLHESHEVNNPDLKQDTSKAASDAIYSIANTSTANPVAATFAIDQIRIAAQNTEHEDVAKLASQKIAAIRQAAPAAAAPYLPAQTSQWP